jgi:PAS domain S-box-containing protein
VSIFGRAEAEVLGTPLARLFAEGDADVLVRTLERAARAGERLEPIELLGRRADGVEIPLELSVGRWTEGPHASLCCIFRDVSERRGAERQRRQLEEHLREAHKLEAVGQLAAGIAHEINTPLQFVSDNTHFLRDGTDSLLGLIERCRELATRACAHEVEPHQVDELERAIEAADLEFLVEELPRAVQQSLEGIERVTNIVRAMRDFSHPGTSATKPIDLNRAIETATTLSRNEWKYIAELTTELDPDLPLVACHGGEISQVILILVVNAAHAIAEKAAGDGDSRGTIRVTSRLVGGMAEVRVEDSGTGIPEAVRGRIFEPFFTTKEVGRGTGQGLAIAHAVVTQGHGGTLAFETELGRGTTFVVRLPLEGRAGPPAHAAACGERALGAVLEHDVRG